jgi:predicted AAA+ superfamily ATPase
LEALFIVFVVRPWHHNIGRAVLQAPKVYFYDTGLVDGDEGIRFENLVATALYKQVQWQHDVRGQEAGLHYLRTKDGAEVEFATAGMDQKLFVSRYLTQLPSAEQLKAFLERDRDDFQALTQQRPHS